MQLRIRPIFALGLLTAAAACGGGGGSDLLIPNFFTEDLAIDARAPVTALSHSPAVCCARDRGYAVWIEERGALDQRVLFSRSSNGGASWNSVPIRLDTGPQLSGARASPQICCDGDRIYVCWLDARRGTPDVRFNRSLDGGFTWLGADLLVNVSQANALTHTAAVMCCEGDEVHIAFVSREDNSLRVALSRDAGGGFASAPFRIHGPAARPAEPTICCDRGEVYVGWADSRDGLGDIYVNRSADGGTSWQVDGVRIDRGVAGSAHSRRPRMCCVARRVYVAWEDGRDGGSTVYVNRSVDGAATWRTTDTRMDTELIAPTAVGGYDVCCEGAELYVAWSDDRNGDTDLYVRRSTNSGLDFDPELRLDLGGLGASPSLSPRLCCEGPNVGVAWVEGDPANVEVTYSTNDGETWVPVNLRMNTVDDVVVPTATPALCCDGRNVYVAWSDLRAPPGWQIRLNASRPR